MNLSNLIASAKGLPAVVPQKPVQPPGNTVVLADVSGSMIAPVGAKRAVDVVQEAINVVVPTIAAPILLAFHSFTVRVHSGEYLPEPQGSTALHLALSQALTFKPVHCIVLSDGMPDNPDHAITFAVALKCPIDVLYCGAEGNAAAIAFMQRLAAVSGGRVILRDVAKYKSPVDASAQLQRDLKTLALPPPRK